jgi:hypothetical protein
MYTHYNHCHRMTTHLQSNIHYYYYYYYYYYNQVLWLASWIQNTWIICCVLHMYGVE